MYIGLDRLIGMLVDTWEQFLSLMLIQTLLRNLIPFDKLPDGRVFTKRDSWVY